MIIHRLRKEFSFGWTWVRLSLFLHSRTELPSLFADGTPPRGTQQSIGDDFSALSLLLSPALEAGSLFSSVLSLGRVALDFFDDGGRVCGEFFRLPAPDLSSPRKFSPNQSLRRFYTEGALEKSFSFGPFLPF